MAEVCHIAAALQGHDLRPPRYVSSGRVREISGAARVDADQSNRHTEGVPVDDIAQRLRRPQSCLRAGSTGPEGDVM
jgi:hypothetical protein